MNKEELIGKLQMVYVGDKNALNELIGYYDGLKLAIEDLKSINEEHRKINGKLREENQKYKEVIDKAIEYIDILVLGEKENGEPYLFKEDAEGQYLLDILKEVE